MTLTQYLTWKGLSIRSFANECGLAWHTIRNAKLGKNITLQTALIITKTSKNMISLDDLKIDDL